MFCKSVCLLLAFCNSFYCNLVLSGSLLNINDKVTNQIRTRTFLDEMSLEQLFDTDTRRRSRRGIVLIDEDFDVPPEQGVKQGWSDGSSNKHATEGDSRNIATTFDPEEGSGISMEEYTTTKVVHNVTPNKLQLTSHTNQPSTASPLLTAIEGSGDDISGPSTVGDHPRIVLGKSIPAPCLNSICERDDVIVLPGLTETAPEGTNLTISCIVTNTTQHGTLQWYKRNENGSSLVETSDQPELHLDIHQTLLRHSGTYMCVLLREQSCCHKKLEIIVYEIPSYKHHLIIIGIVAAVCLFTCVLLGIHRSFKAKKYEVQLELQDMEKPILL